MGEKQKPNQNQKLKKRNGLPQKQTWMASVWRLYVRIGKDLDMSCDARGTVNQKSLSSKSKLMESFVSRTPDGCVCDDV